MKLFRSASGPPGPSRESARLPMKRTSGMRRWPAVSLIVTLPVLALGACTGTSQRSSAVPEVRIGLLGAMSGSASGTGQAAARGAQLAGLVSADSARATAVASERTERIGVPFLSSVASADFLTERGLDWYFRVTPTDQLIAEAALAYVQKNGGGGAERIGIVHAGDATSNDSASSAEGLAKEAGDDTTDAAFDSGQDARSAVVQVHHANPGAVIAVASQSGDAKSLLTAG